MRLTGRTGKLVPGNTMPSIGRTSSIWSLRLNRAALACLVNAGSSLAEGDLRHLAVVGPFGGNKFGALRSSAVQILSAEARPNGCGARTAVRHGRGRTPCCCGVLAERVGFELAVRFTSAA